MTDDDQAAAWALRLADGDAADPATRAALESWLAADPRRAGSLLRAEAALAYVGRARALPRDDRNAPIRARAGRRRLLRWTAAAAVAAAVAGIAGLVRLPDRGTQFATAIGEVRRIPLGDGSIAALNTASTLSFAQTAGERRARIDRGEVWFQVAHDRARPFVVESGPVRIRAVGTAFSVRRRDGGTEVLVTDGIVETWVEGAALPPARVAAGHRAVLDDAGRPDAAIALDADGRSSESIDRALAWRGGDLAFDGETLARAAAELNRHNVRQVRVDPRLAGVEIVGYFRTTDPVAFARAAAMTVGGRTIVTDTTITIAPADR